jgi:hypothetical protein
VQALCPVSISVQWSLCEMKTCNKIVMTYGLLFVLTGSIPGSLRAEAASALSEDFEPVHWAYSSFFGTGWYSMEDVRSVFALQIPIRQTVRESSLSDAGERKFGIEIKYPLTIGLHDVEDLGGIVDNDNFGTITFAPGVELEIPINQRWYLRPIAHIGYGRELQDGESAWVYYTGIKSRYIFPSKTKNEWSLLNGLYYAGYSPDKGRSDHMAVATIGVELRQPLSNAKLMGRPIDLHWNLMYTFLGNELHFNLPDGSFDPIKDHLELGLAMSFRDGPYKLWFINVHRLGLGYRFSSSGEFTAITFHMRSWFTK